MFKRPVTSRAQRALELAEGAAAAAGDEFLGTEHLLLGLLEERGGPAALILQHLGVTDAKVRRLLAQMRAPAE